MSSLLPICRIMTYLYTQHFHASVVDYVKNACFVTNSNRNYFGRLLSAEWFLPTDRASPRYILTMISLYS